MSVVTLDPQTSKDQTEARNNSFYIINAAIAAFLGNLELAAVLDRIHYWVQNEYSGYLDNDGKKWIYNRYSDWVKQFPCIKLSRIGRIVRHLERIRWIETRTFSELKKGIGFVGENPRGFQDDNQTKFYWVNYQLIYTDTGVDLLFDKKSPKKQSATPKSPEPAPGNDSPPTQTRKRAPRASIQNCTLKRSNLDPVAFKSEPSSIYKEFQTTTKLSQEEREKVETVFDQEKMHEEEVHDNGTDVKGVQEKEQEVSESSGQVEKLDKENLEHALILEVDQCSAAAPLPTEKIVKHKQAERGMETVEVRPPRQSPKGKYPEGAWLTERGLLNGDFVMDRVALWRTGDTRNSQSFGKMAVEDVAGLVASYYAKPEHHHDLEIHWVAYVEKSKRYIGNVKQRTDAGIQIPLAEQTQIVAKIPGIMSEPVEPAYESCTVNVEQLVFLQLPQPSTPSLPALPAERKTPAPPVDEEGGCQNPQAYTNTVKPEDHDHWANLKNVQIEPKPPKQGVGRKKISSVGDIIGAKDFKPDET